MTGPEHYRESENALLRAQDSPEGSNSERYNLAAAQVHATLALAAAGWDPWFGAQPRKRIPS